MRAFVSACLAAACAAGCSAGQPPAANDLSLDGAASAPALHRARSWMAPGAKKIDLLYVSDYQTNDVYAYSYPQGKLRGVLAGVLRRLVYPSGLCADAAGNVFIPNNSNSTVLEYPHGSTKLLRTFVDSDEYPYTCAVDAARATLAVIDLQAVSGSRGGGVSIYERERSQGKHYSETFVYFYYYGAFDAAGDLFVDAANQVPSLPFVFVELPKGGRSLQTVTLEQSFSVPGGVAWDGKHVTVGDSKDSTIYRFDITGSTGIEVGSTHLQRGRFVTQYVIDGDTLVGANFHGSSVMFWKYPAGGAPTKIIGGLGEPFGVALSRASR
jgi:hypothetical protein